MGWVKLHTDILGDPKLMRAARKGARHLLYLPWLIAFAKQADDGGRLTVNGQPVEPDDIADLIPGATPTAVRRCLEELEEIGVLLRVFDENPTEIRPTGTKTSEIPSHLAFARWDVRAGAASNTREAWRERKQRQRHKSERPETVTRDTVGTSRESHALEKDVEIERDVEKKKKNPPTPRTHSRSAAAPSSPAAPSPERANWVTEFGEDWRRIRRGNPPFGTIGKELRPLYGEHGADVLRPAWIRFLEGPKAQYGAHYFATHLGDFLDPARSPPDVPNGRYNAGEATFRNARKIFGTGEDS